MEEVKTKFEVENPLQVIDLLGLMGDSADNIPGCPGVGAKTAVKLLADFGSIEGLLSHTDQLKGALKKKSWRKTCNKFVSRKFKQPSLQTSPST